MTSISPEDLEAATAGRYRVERMIGAGGMGAVFLAVHRELGSRVAIKTLPPDVRFNPSRLARFRREAALSAQLSHPHLVPVFELDVTEDLAYLVMPYIDGTTLQNHLRTVGPLSWDELLILLEEIGGALTHAHRRGIIHRDIKPANILLERETGRWLLTDFGVAHVTRAEDTDLTQSGATIGTMAYMAPEQLGGARDVDARADIYALAAVACEALTGVPPDREGQAETARVIAGRCPELSHDRIDALTAPLATPRDERPPSVAEWLAMLRTGARRRRLPSLSWMLAAGVSVALAGWIVARLASSPVENEIPVIAVLPFSVAGSTPGLNLDSVLTQSFAWQLKSFPDHRVIEESAVRTAIRMRYGATPRDRDSLLMAARQLDATLALLGSATGSADTVSVRVELYDPRTARFVTGAEAAGSPDSLQSLIAQLVVESFATTIAQERLGTASVSLPAGVQAVSEYFQGDRAFRRGAFESAIQHFDRVITLDSTFAPAYLKRTMAKVFRVRPTQLGAEIRSALEATKRYGDRLDPVSQQIVAGYATLLDGGDLPGAARTFRQIVDAHPGAVDAWFLLGVLQVRFPTLLGSSLREARNTLQEVVARDPGFAAAFGLLALLAINGNDAAATRHFTARFLELDPNSVRADLLRLADTLFFRPQLLPQVLSTFQNRPSEVLEYLALPAGELRPPGGGRAVGTHAVDVLRPRAATPVERAVTFRMRLAIHLGAGEVTDARRLHAHGTETGVPREELDSWAVLAAVTFLPDLADRPAVQQAATRLAESDSSAVHAWLAARWEQESAGGRRSRGWDVLARTAADSSAGEHLLARSLLRDLEAHDHLVAGDTVEAMAAWDDAVTRYSIGEVPFGLLGSYWPIHAERARIGARSGDLDAVFASAAVFKRMAGFLDQVAWQPVLMAEGAVAAARGERARAETSYRDLLRAYRTAQGPEAQIRDSVEALLAVLR